MRSVEADVFVPEGGVVEDEVGHEGDAGGGGEVEDGDVDGAEPVDAAGEGLGFADDEGAEAELADESAAVPAGGEGGDDDEVAVGALAAGAAEGVGFGVDGGVGLLDATIAAGTDEVAGGGEDGGADGDAAFGEAEAGFREGDLKHGGGGGEGRHGSRITLGYFGEEGRGEGERGEGSDGVASGAGATFKGNWMVERDVCLSGLMGAGS